MKFTTRLAAIIAAALLLVTMLAIPAMASDTTTTEAAASTSSSASSFFTPSVIVPLIILVVVVIACVIVFFVLPARREKTFKFFRGLKSEWNKVSWFSWENTLKGSLVVAGIAVALAIVIGLLDVGFSSGINALDTLF